MATTGRYILYADDDQDDQELMHDLMQEVETDIYIKAVHNGIEVLDFLSNLAIGDDFPSLIVLDINMPVVGGFQTLKLLKLNPKFAHIPVVVFSTSNLEEEQRKSLRFGAMEYISKPMFYQDAIIVFRRLSDFCKAVPLRHLM